MPRYDRIARIEPPAREKTFPAWMTLRDLEGREREPQLGRRARLRFLALRPVRRLLRQGLDRPSARSLGRQLDGVRDALESLPANDPERRCITAYLEEVGGRTPLGLLTATLDVGAAAEAAGHTFAAEEFYRTGLEITEMHGLLAGRVRAFRRLARVHRTRGQWDAAADLYTRSAALAETVRDMVQWARARAGIASVEALRGEPDVARRTLDAVAERGVAIGDIEVRAVAAAARCALERAEGRLETAVEAGWHALQLMDPAAERRNGVLLDMASCFRWLGLRAAAESCYGIVAVRSAWPEHRIEARTEHAVVAAEADNPDAFHSRREHLLDRFPSEDPRLAALVDLGLGRGCMMIGEEEAARQHLRRAITTARDASLDVVLPRAEELLTALERNAGVTGPARPLGAACEAALEIAHHLETLGSDLARTP